MRQKYDTLLWDVDNTLLNFDRSQDYAIRESFRQYGVEIDTEIVKAYREINDSYWRRLEKREIEKKEVLIGRFVTLFEELSPLGSLAKKEIDNSLLKQIPIDAFAKFYQDALGSVYYYLDDSISLCRKLKQQGYRQYIITNGVRHSQRNKLKLAGFYDIMDDVFISEEIGYNKPDVRFFEGCFERMRQEGCRAEVSRMLVIGDSQTADMQGARNSGIDCCLYLGQKVSAKDGADDWQGREWSDRTDEAAEQNVTYVIYHLWELEGILCQNRQIKN